MRSPIKTNPSEKGCAGGKKVGSPTGEGWENGGAPSDEYRTTALFG